MYPYSYLTTSLWAYLNLMGVLGEDTVSIDHATARVHAAGQSWARRMMWDPGQLL
jgi:hypothetical protein